ncbi:hypothetical protein VTI74DRAFT_7242 [Chaetomium olivicolor]
MDSGFYWERRGWSILLTSVRGRLRSSMVTRCAGRGSWFSNDRCPVHARQNSDELTTVFRQLSCQGRTPPPPSLPRVLACFPGNTGLAPMSIRGLPADPVPPLAPSGRRIYDWSAVFNPRALASELPFVLDTSRQRDIQEFVIEERHQHPYGTTAQRLMSRA